MGLNVTWCREVQFTEISTGLTANVPDPLSLENRGESKKRFKREWKYFEKLDLETCIDMLKTRKFTFFHGRGNAVNMNTSGTRRRPTNRQAKFSMVQIRNLPERYTAVLVQASTAHSSVTDVQYLLVSGGQYAAVVGAHPR